MSHRGLNIPELLAPAGDLQSLQTAAKNGADAVYFGLERFNARSNAANLTVDQLPEAIGFLHERSTRAYLTLNTLLRDDELMHALQMAAEAYTAGIDALIVQDIGLARLLRTWLPDLVLHGSTQMTLTGLPDLQLAADLGLKRVILPREMSLGEIRERSGQAAALDLETEVFVHGALCVSYSGQCIMSGLLGGRSGNRGSCAQPCRLAYQLHPARQPAAATRPAGSKSAKELPGQALLSPKDQALLAHLPSIIQTGVASLKVEGRMRGPAYVGQVVAVYRQALDWLADYQHRGSDLAQLNGDPTAQGLSSENQAWQKLLVQDLPRLQLAFNRGGSFTAAYLLQQSREMFTSSHYPGSFGVLLGTVRQTDIRQGQLQIMQSVQADIVPGKGDVLSVRRESTHHQVQEIASAPIGDCQRQGRLLVVRGFHPEVLSRFQEGDAVYRMTDAKAERLTLQADDRKTPIALQLTAPVADTVQLTAVVSSGPFQGRKASASLAVLADLADRQPAAQPSGDTGNRQPADQRPGDTASHLPADHQPAEPLQTERVWQQLAKTGGTPFRVSEISCDQAPSLSIAQLNGLRRLVLQALQGILQQVGCRPWPELPMALPNAAALPAFGPAGASSWSADMPISDRGLTSSGHDIAVFFHQLPAAPADLPCGADIYEIPLLSLNDAVIDRYIQPLRRVEPACRIYAWSPPALTGRLAELVPSILAGLPGWTIDGLVTAWPAYQDNKATAVAESTATELAVPVAKSRLPGWTAETSANLFNRFSLAAAMSAGADTVCPSLELNGQQLAATIAAWQADRRSAGSVAPWRIELPVYGRLRLMSSAYCPVGKNRPGCQACVSQPAAADGLPDPGKAYVLLDRRQQAFVQLTHPRSCHTDLLNADLLSVPDLLAELTDQLTAEPGLMPSFRARVYCLEETADERCHLVDAYRRLLLNLDSGQRAAFLAAADQTARSIAGRLGCRLTEGHARRGVQ